MKGEEAVPKPGMRMVRLKAEEAVLTACKDWSSGGHGAYMPGGFGDFGNCQKIYGYRIGVRRCNITGS